MTAYTDIAAYYAGLALPLAQAAALTEWPEDSDAIPITEAMSDSVHNTVRTTDRLVQEES